MNKESRNTRTYGMSGVQLKKIGSGDWGKKSLAAGAEFASS
jgi:hypothetical protein